MNSTATQSEGRQQRLQRARAFFRMKREVQKSVRIFDRKDKAKNPSEPVVDPRVILGNICAGASQCSSKLQPGFCPSSSKVSTTVRTFLKRVALSEPLPPQFELNKPNLLEVDSKDLLPNSPTSSSSCLLITKKQEDSSKYLTLNTDDESSMASSPGSWLSLNEETKQQSNCSDISNDELDSYQSSPLCTKFLNSEPGVIDANTSNVMPSLC